MAALNPPSFFRSSICNLAQLQPEAIPIWREYAVGFDGWDSISIDICPHTGEKSAYLINFPDGFASFLKIKFFLSTRTSASFPYSLKPVDSKCKKQIIKDAIISKHKYAETAEMYYRISFFVCDESNPKKWRIDYVYFKNLPEISLEWNLYDSGGKKTLEVGVGLDNTTPIIDCSYMSSTFMEDDAP